MQNSIGRRIKAQRNKMKLTQRELAKAVGLTTSAISMWEADTTRPSGENLTRLVKVLGVTPEWLYGDDATGNVERITQPATLVPLISWVQAGAFCESPDLFTVGDAQEWLLCPSVHSRGTYALRVNSDSMTSTVAGARSYPHGTIIFVDPERAYSVGSRVIVRLPNSSETTFKVYTEDAGQAYLKPINSQYPTMPMPNGAVICGVVIGSYLPE